MKRITTMNLDIHAQRSHGCIWGCPFLTYLQNNTLQFMRSDHIVLQSSKKYTQFFMLISPHKRASIPEDLSEAILSFHKSVQNLNLNQDRTRIINLIKYTVFSLNKAILRWNAAHSDEEPLYLNLTIVFVYGDHLILLNFGQNIIYMYRDGDLAGFNGPRLDSEIHYSLNTGQAGRTEYMLFKEEVPPLGEATFESKQIMTLFKLSHRLLKDDMLVVLTENSVNIPTLRVHVNLYEHVIDSKALLKLISMSKLPKTPNYAWSIFTFSEVQEVQQTVRYAFFNTPKGIISYLLLLLTLLIPLIYDREFEEDYTPVHTFSTPPITSYVTIVDTDITDALDIIPDLSESVISESPDASAVMSPYEIITQARLRWNHLHLSDYTSLEIDPYSVFGSEAPDLFLSLSKKYYDTDAQRDIIEFMNPELQWARPEMQTVRLPVFSIPRTSRQDLHQISTLYYGTALHAELLKEENGQDALTPPYTASITVGPLMD